MYYYYWIFCSKNYFIRIPLLCRCPGKSNKRRMTSCFQVDQILPFPFFLSSFPPLLVPLLLTTYCFFQLFPTFPSYSCLIWSLQHHSLCSFRDQHLTCRGKSCKRATENNLTCVDKGTNKTKLNNNVMCHVSYVKKIHFWPFVHFWLLLHFWPFKILYF